MLVQILLGIFIGLLCGTFTGLAPGIHVNLVCAILVANAAFFLGIASLPAIIAFVIALSVTHTYLDSIPSVFLGAPSTDKILGVLPGHRYLLRGEGLIAIRLMQIGALAASSLTVLLAWPLALLLTSTSRFLSRWLAPLLLGLVLFQLVMTRDRLLSVGLFLLSGLFGLLVFSLQGLENSLFALLSGLFGAATLVTSSHESIPLQKTSTTVEIGARGLATAAFAGEISGLLTAIFPGLGSGSAATLSTAFAELKEELFLVVTGVIGTVNFLASIITYWVIDKARNGSIVAVREFAGSATPGIILICCGSALVAAGLASLLLSGLAPRFLAIMARIPYGTTVKGVLVLLFVLAGVLCGWWGLVIMTTGTALGLIAQQLNIQRIHLMGCLIVPVLTYLF